MLSAKHKDIEFGVGDQIRVSQRIKEGEKERVAVFSGMVLGIKGREPFVTFIIRKIGEAGVGIEKIYPLSLPSIEKIELIKRGQEGIRHAKLYYTRTKSPREIDQIYSRAFRKGNAIKKVKTLKVKKNKSPKKVVSKAK